jgi:hypothetical protein
MAFLSIGTTQGDRPDRVAPSRIDANELAAADLSDRNHPGFPVVESARLAARR